MFGQNLSELRRQSGRTQEETAKLIGVAKTTYASYEQGKRTPDAEIQGKLADLFNVTLDYLHGRKSSNSNDEIELDDGIDGYKPMSYRGKQIPDADKEILKRILKGLE